MIKMQTIEQQVDTYMAMLAQDPLRGLFNGDEWILRAKLKGIIVNGSQAPDQIHGLIGDIFVDILQRDNLIPASHAVKCVGPFYADHHEMIKEWWYKAYDLDEIKTDTGVIFKFNQIPEVIIILKKSDIILGLRQLRCSRELIKRFGTPHVDEILTLRLLPQILPQPIAEAIADCMHGVITRRIIERSEQIYHPWNTPESMAEETDFDRIDQHYSLERAYSKLAEK